MRLSDHQVLGDIRNSMEKREESLLETPLGPIRVLVDGDAVRCTAERHSCGLSLAGCYRVRLEGAAGQEISCLLENPDPGGAWAPPARAIRRWSLSRSVSA